MKAMSRRFCLCLRLVVTTLAFCLVATGPARAWDDAINEALKAVATGNPSEAQLKLLRQNNDLINRMATQGAVPNDTYQKVQKDFDAFNAEVTRKAAADAGLDYTKQKSTKDPTPGTDTDNILSNRQPPPPAGADPNLPATPDQVKPVTPQQIQTARDSYNSRMNTELGTKDVDYARKLDTDLMADPKNMSPADFEKVADMNNDAYRRTQAAEYEKKKRDIAEWEKGVNDGKIDPEVTKKPPEITSAESKAYTDEMLDMADKKSGQIEHKLDEAIKDPTNPDLDAELTTKQQKQAKYTDRLNTETDRIYNEQVKPKVDADRAPAPEPSDLPGRAADRGITATDDKVKQMESRGQLVDSPDVEPAVADLNKNNAASANALEDHLTSQAIKNNAEVRAGAGSVGDTPEVRQQNIKDAADLGNRLSPSQQGELIENVRTKYGDKAAQDLAAEMRNQKVGTEIDGPRVNVDGDGALSKITKVGRGVLNAAGEVMVGVDIANTGQDILDVGDGKKDAGAAAVDAVDRVTGGAISTVKTVGEKGSDFLDARSTLQQAQAQLDEARVLETGLELRNAGVSKEEVVRIMSQMRNGDESGLNSKVNELKENGVELAMPQKMDAGSVSGDDTVVDRAVQVGQGMKEQAVRGAEFVKQTGKNVLEIGTGLTEDGVAQELIDQQKGNLTFDNFVQGPGSIVSIVKANRDAFLQGEQQKEQRQGLIDRLIEMGADPNEAANAVDKFQKGDKTALNELKGDLLPKPPEDGTATPGNGKGDGAADDLFVSNPDGDGAKVDGLRTLEGNGNEPGEDADGASTPGMLETFTQHNDDDNAQATATATGLLQQQNEMDAASTTDDGQVQNSRNQIEAAQSAANQIRTAAIDEVNKQDAENGIGSQITAGLEQAIQTGFASAGTSIGTAVGQEVVDGDRNDRDRDRGQDGDRRGTTAQTGGSKPPKKPKPPAPSSGDSSSGVSDPSSGSGASTPPVATGPRCPICGRINCPYITRSGSGSKSP